MRKSFFVGVLVACIIAVASMVSWRGYKVWRQARLMRQTKEFLAKSDVRNALLSLQQALRSDPYNVEACRLMADFAEAARSPSALLWRQRVVDLEPGLLTNRLFWARAALALGDAATARKALDSVDEPGKKTAAYHKTAGAVASAAGQSAEAQAHFLEASRLEPDNASTRMNLAVLQLQQDDPQVVAAAQATLESLRTNAAVRCEALRQLTVDAVRRNKSAAALSLVNELLLDTNSAFGDRLLYLDVLRQAKNPRLQEALATLKQDAAKDPAQSSDLAQWLLATGEPEEAIAWVHSLPAETQTNQPMPMILADCYLATSDWPALLAAPQQSSWGELDFLRLLYRTRALRARQMDAAAKSEWAKSVKVAEGRLDRLSLLLRGANRWNWLPEQEEILWLIVNRYPNEKWAFQGLAELLHATGQTRSLLTLFARAADIDPRNLSAKNNLALVALLLNASEKKPHDLARELYEKNPQNRFYVSTYAFSLHLQAKGEDAVQVLERLKPEQLEDPSIAAYYGIILEAAGYKPKAKAFLDLAAKARLLPEERRLVDRARTRL
jgi:predicted Zn-dependent protease